ncbi:MAG: flagellar basal body L-ring protein FlgH [Pirellulaceae bacterium]
MNSRNVCRRKPIRPRGSWCGLFVLVTVFVCWEPPPTKAQSLWDRRAPNYQSALVTQRASRRGDLLNVIITENTNINNRDQRQLNKQNASTANGEGSFGLSGVVGSAVGGTEADEATASSRSQNSNTQYRTQRGFQDRMQVMVSDVLPNGNLQIIGTRETMIDGDIRNMILTGEIRSLDISTTNTINSTQVYNLKMEYETGGAESHFINQGWLGKKLNRIWPF